MTENRGPTLLHLLRGVLGNATPDTITPGSAGDPGVATLGSRQDHDHPAPSFPVLDAVNPAAIVSGQGAAPGVAASASHRDHQHATPALLALGVATPEAIVSGQAGAAGNAAAAAHENHVHATPALLALDATTPAAIVSGQAGAAGGAATGAHRDHVHATPVLSSLALDSVTPVAVTPGSVGGVGSDPDASHGDHEHPATNVPTVASVTAAAAAAAAVVTGVAAITGDRRITIGTEITNATKPTSSGQSVRWDATHSVLFVGSLTGGGAGLRAYPFSGANPGVFSAPVVATTGNVTSFQISVRPGGAHVASADTATPWIRVYPWSGSAWGAAISPGTPPAGSGAPNAVAWRPDGAFVALGRSANGGNPELMVFPFNGSALGTVITLASQGQNVGGLAWSPDGLYLFVAWSNGNTLRITAHAFDGVTIGAAIQPGSTLPDNVVADVAVSPDGNWVAIATADSVNKLWVYPWSAGAFGAPVKRATPQGNRLAWAPDQAYIGLAYSTPFVSVVAFYPTGAGSFGAQVDFTLTGTPTGAQDVTFSADGAYAAAAYDGTTKFGAFPGTRLFGY